MNFIYPRLVSIRRPIAAGGVGDQGYSGLRGPEDEKEIFCGLPASIQLDRQGQRNPVDLPSDARFQAIWKVFIPASAAKLGDIQPGDVVVDDLGARHQVFAPYWNQFGYQLRCIVLEV